MPRRWRWVRSASCRWCSAGVCWSRWRRRTICQRWDGCPRRRRGRGWRRESCARCRPSSWWRCCGCTTWSWSSSSRPVACCRRSPGTVAPRRTSSPPVTMGFRVVHGSAVYSSLYLEIDFHCMLTVAVVVINRFAIKLISLFYLYFIAPIFFY